MSIEETSNGKKCFVIMPISDAEGYEAGHFSRVYEHLIKPAVKEAGFEPVRADDTSKANFIVVDILQQILDCDIAICDLSARNPNVFYELGVRQAFNKKTVLICDNKTVRPFDTSGIRTLPYNASLRIDEVKKNIPELIKCIQETIDAKEKDVNSLIQLLSIEKPASIPNKVTLSQDSSLILNAIKDLNRKIDFVAEKDNRVTFEIVDNDQIKLPNGKKARIGENIYDSANLSTPLGVLEGEASNHILLRNSKKELIGIPKAGERGMLLTDLPF
jgi:hypothetical protein